MDGGATPTAEFDEICGHVGPHQIFAIEDDQALGYSMEFDGGFLFGVHDLGELPYDGSDPEIVGRSIWWVGPCGEDRRLVDSAHALESGLSPRGADYVVGSSATELVAIDPRGNHDPIAIAELRDNDKNVMGRLLSLTGPDEMGRHTLSQLRFDPQWDPWTQAPDLTTIATDIVIPEGTQWHDGWPSAGRLNVYRTDGLMLYVDAQDRLIQVDESGSANVLLEDVWLFWPGGYDYVVWMRRSGLGGDLEDPVGTFYLSDLVTGEVRELFEGPSSTYVRFMGAWPGAGVDSLWLSTRSGGSGIASWRLENLNTGLVVERPLGQAAYYPVDDYRWIVDAEAGFGVDSVHLLTGERIAVVSENWSSMTMRAEGLVYMEWGTPCSLCGDAVKSGKLVLSDPLTGEQELLAPRAGIGWSAPAPGVILTKLMWSTALGGDLVLYEREAMRESLIDRRVRGSGVIAHPAWEHPVLTYSVVGPERAGIWIANLPALANATVAATAAAGIAMSPDGARHGGLNRDLDAFDPWRSDTLHAMGSR